MNIPVSPVDWLVHPRNSQKLLKPVYASLRQLGCTIVPYLDDSYLQGDDKLECSHMVKATVMQLQDLGKSQYEPSQQLEFLGFLLNSQTMTVRLTPQKS